KSRSLERSIQGLSLDRLPGCASDARPSLFPRPLEVFFCPTCHRPIRAMTALALRFGGGCAISHFSQLLLNAQIALGDLLLYLAVVLQRLAEHEEQFWAVIARQRCFDLGLAFPDSMMRQRGQFCWITFPC